MAKGKPAEEKGNDPAATYGKTRKQGDLNTGSEFTKHLGKYKSDPAARYVGDY